MPVIDIVTPTLWRAARLAGYTADVHAATDCDHVVTFIVEPDDHDTRQAVEALAAVDPGVRWFLNERVASVVGAFNTGAAHVEAPWWFAAGDDCHFTRGWDTILFDRIEPHVKVIGTNDLYNPYVLSGQSATHMLIDTEYTRTLGLTLDDGPGIAGHEGFHHNFFDTELVQVAKVRGVWQSCLESVVEHRHPTWGKAEHDATYARNMRHWREDGDLWAIRRRQFHYPD